MKKKIIFLLGILFLLLSKGFAFATDPHLFLSPASGNFSGNFEVEIKVDTGGQAAGGVDVHLEFPKNLLKIEKVTKGDAFTEVFSSIKNDDGKLRINAYFPFTEAGKSFKSDSGLIAKINFSPLGTGTAAVTFTCTQGSTPDSNIVEKIDVKDIIVCSANTNGSYNLTAATQPTATPTSGVAPTATPPVSGSLTQTLGVLGLGIFTILTGLVLMF